MIESRSGFARLLLGLVVAYAVLQGTAAGLQSIRGEFGLVVAASVVLTLVAAGRTLFTEPLPVAWRALGLGRPAARGVLAAAALSAALVTLLAAQLVTSDTAVRPWPGWPLLAIGIFAQAGIAEEALFRGYLFGRLYPGRSFRRAAVVAALPFILVHLLLFASMSWPVAAASLVLAASMSFPLSQLFELGGKTIWPPAIVHFVAQGALKLIVLPEARMQGIAIAWIVACTVLPWAVFLVPRPRVASDPSSGAPSIPALAARARSGDSWS